MCLQLLHVVYHVLLYFYVMYALQCMISLMLYSVFQINNRIEKTKSPYIYILKKTWAEMVMGRNGMGRNGYGPKWSWAEMVMGRNDPEPFHWTVGYESRAVRKTLPNYTSSFFPQTTRDWNDLPDSLISSTEMSDDCVSKFAALVRARD